MSARSAYLKLRRRWIEGTALRNGRRALIRPAWASTDKLALGGAEESLHRLEKIMLEEQSIYLDCARIFLGDERVEEVGALLSAAKEDLVAGCELARAGYSKQAFTLWRSWFEQEMFALYFLESPISKRAWKVSETVSVTDRPVHRLMLHQLLASSGDKHPFAVVYESRFDSVMLLLRISNIPRQRRILSRTDGIFTALSQGVHGTFRPRAPASRAHVGVTLEKVGIPALAEANQVLGSYWVCFLVDSLGLDDVVVSELKAGKLDSKDARFVDMDGIQHISRLNDPFKKIIAGI